MLPGTPHRRHLTTPSKYRTLCRRLNSSNGWTSTRYSGLSIICQGLTSSACSPHESNLIYIYLRWLAAQELKKQSWRFHVKFLTWFQRHAKPDEVTEEYEQGQYLYFDWEGSWCVRKKSDFRFEYRNLSEE